MRELVTPRSSNISKIDWEDQVLTVHFINGNAYEYYDVPESLFDDFELCEDSKGSIGKMFNTEVKERYNYKKIK